MSARGARREIARARRRPQLAHPAAPFKPGALSAGWIATGIGRKDRENPAFDDRVMERLRLDRIDRADAGRKQQPS